MHTLSFLPHHQTLEPPVNATDTHPTNSQPSLLYSSLLPYAIYHRLRGSASPVLTATGFVNGKWQFSTPHRIDTPQPITKKFVTGDYVGDPYGRAKLHAYPSTGVLGTWVKYNQN